MIAKVGAAMGGRLRIGLSGCAVLSRETHQFLTLAVIMVMVHGTWYSHFSDARPQTFLPGYGPKEKAAFLDWLSQRAIPSEMI
jgi:VanZ family protein